jgi:hypothetical protein
MSLPLSKVSSFSKKCICVPLILYSNFIESHKAIYLEIYYFEETIHKSNDIFTV